MSSILYIPIQLSLRDHPKLHRLAKATGLPPVHLIGHLVSLWTWAASYAPDGDLTRFSAMEISEACRMVNVNQPAHAESWLKELVSAGWVDPDGRLHDWGDHGGEFGQKRAKDAERKRAEREKARLEKERLAALKLGAYTQYEGDAGEGREASVDVRGPCSDSPRTVRGIRRREGEEGGREDVPSESSSEVKDEEEDRLGVIPQLKEVVTEGSLRNIPPGFCEFFHVKTTANRAWFTKEGLPRRWRHDLRAWWLRDQANWREPKGAAASGRASTEIEAELKATPVTDKPRRAELIAELEAARHREKGNPK